jgi:hypothetical protein
MLLLNCTLCLDRFNHSARRALEPSLRGGMPNETAIPPGGRSEGEAFTSRFPYQQLAA